MLYSKTITEESVKLESKFSYKVLKTSRCDFYYFKMDSFKSHGLV